ncbi:MAG: D-glycero-beta-D-manno-heptose 1-phosphate adenylyltransferase [Sphingobacteriales bacterium]|nr:MAG: D-glycero-beta-D-manno-heptose 1-phosphate adenylyltransferase [Sphingobacteriales bacterium]TAF80545.1 MAG: D-glycero-beta-D-manno-heptose 1-phosphate adenylyltransferase [Sphingobacteriales bacterium]
MNKLQIIQHKIFTLSSIYHQLNIWRFGHQKIVFTNGCFDIMHLGHIDYLSKAADMGNKLIIGLNSDTSTQKLKGNTRPINNELSRSALLASLFFVDAVIIFDDPTPLNLINHIKPDVLVKGADYTIPTIVGANEVLKYGGKVTTIPLIEGYSTSAIEQKILNAHA